MPFLTSDVDSADKMAQKNKDNVPKGVKVKIKNVQTLKICLPRDILEERRTRPFYIKKVKFSKECDKKVLYDVSTIFCMVAF